jgi:hypothetical protein
MLKTVEFPLKPHVRKYLSVHLRLALHADTNQMQPYVLSTSDQFGKMLYHLLRRQVKGRLHHTESREDCTQVLTVDLRNFPAYQFGLTQVTDYTIFHFNDFVDENLRQSLYEWVRLFASRRRTIKEIITDFMAVYDLREEDIQYETLRKAVQRNVKLPPRKKRADKSVGKMSQKTDELSRKTGKMSHKSGELSRQGQHRAVREELMQQPSSLIDFIRQQHGATLQ